VRFDVGHLVASRGLLFNHQEHQRDKKMVPGVCHPANTEHHLNKISFGGLFATPVFKGEIYPGAKCRHFAVFNFHVQLGDLCNSKISKGFAGFLNCIFGSFFPGIWAASHQFNNFVDTVSHLLPPFLLRVTAAQFLVSVIAAVGCGYSFHCRLLSMKDNKILGSRNV
jgi:hypothetical protein